jgi:O-antigen ligase
MNEAPLNPLDSFLKNAVRYGLLAVLFLPFVVILEYLYPWVSGKIWGFQILIELLFPLYVLLAFRRKEFRPGTNALTYAVLAFFAVQTLSMLLGDNIHRSLWSKPDRLTGLFFQYHLLAFFLMAGSVWRGKMRLPVTVTVLAASISAIHGIYQWLTGGGDGGRGMATLGNPSYLGQYLVPHVFLVMWLWWRDRASLTRAIWSVLGVVILFGVISTKSRGALLGLFIAAVVSALIISVRGVGRLRFWSRLALAALAASALLLFALDRWSEPAHVWLYEQRLSVQYFKESTGSRKLLYANVLKGIQSHPVLGWGPENFESAYYFHYDPVTLRFSQYETRQDRPHNLILEILVNLGALGLLAYAAMFFFGWKLALGSGDDRKVEGGILVVATVAHLATNLFIFDTPISYMMMYLELAFLAAFIAPTAEAGEDELAQGAIPAAICVAVLTLWIFLGVIVGSIKGANVAARLIIGSQNKMEAATFSEGVQELLRMKTPQQERYVRAVISNISLSRGDYRQDDYAPILREMAAYEAARLDRHRADFVHALVTGTSLMSLWPRTPEEQAQAEKAIASMKRLSPNRQEVLWIEAQSLYEKGDLSGAEALYREAVELDPDSMEAQAMHASFVVFERQDPARGMAYLKSIWPRFSARQEPMSVFARGFIRNFNAGRTKDLVDIYLAARKEGIMTFEWAMAGVIGAVSQGDLTDAEEYAADAKTRFPEKSATIDEVLVRAKAEVSATSTRQ